ncbi:hypothetical protein YC2023_092619 [Brassica napus]
MSLDLMAVPVIIGYGRAGLLGEARDIIHRMLSSAILLNSCHVNGNTEIGLECEKGSWEAWIDTGSELATFSVGDTSSLQACCAYPLFKGLNQLMKDAAGYAIAIYQKQSSGKELQEVE